MPDATSSTTLPTEPSSRLYYLELNSGIGHYRSVANLTEAGCKVYAISFLYNKCSTFPAAWVSGQSYASNSHTPPMCAYN